MGIVENYQEIRNKTVAVVGYVGHFAEIEETVFKDRPQWLFSVLFSVLLPYSLPCSSSH